MKPDRGNILTWEQTLADRRAGQPLRMEVRMGIGVDSVPDAVAVFAMAFAAAVAVLAFAIWMTIRRGKAGRQPERPRQFATLMS